MSNMYAIKEETLNALGDAIRGKGMIPQTRVDNIPYPAYEFDIDYQVSSGSSGMCVSSQTWEKITGLASAKVTYDHIGCDSRYAVYVWTKSTGVAAQDCPPGETIITGLNGYFRYQYNVYDYAKYTKGHVKIEFFDADGNPLTYTETVTNKITVAQMANTINDFEIPVAPPEDKFKLTGICQYMFYGDNWSWFFDLYKDKITTEDLSVVSWMFKDATKIKQIPFTFNVKGSTIEMFSGCYYLESIGDFVDCELEQTRNMFSQCHNLRYLPNFVNTTWYNSGSYAYCREMFTGCHSLRQIPEEFLKLFNGSWTGSSSHFLNKTVGECYVLDEIKGLVPGTGTCTSNIFGNNFVSCFRLKDILFAKSDTNAPIVANWKSQIIDLTTSIGWSNQPASYITGKNSGITADKQVKDDVTYQALKNDPDWFTLDVGYSRYNHDSAVNTINSLPDTSAYCAANNGTNTIKFKGESGSKTDGGAINTLTEEEIAVAAVKGWTVTLV